MDERDLVGAVAAQPDDDGPRLVYADWLIDRGDPRGELIALQCALARADAADAPLADEALVIAREQALLAQHAAAWCAPLEAIAVGGYTVRRGLIEHVTAYDPKSFAEDTPSRLLEAAPCLHSISVNGELVQRPELAAVWGRFSALEIVELLLADDAALFATPLADVRRFSLLNAQVSTALVERLLDGMRALDYLGLGLGTHRDFSGDPDELAPMLGRHAALANLRGLHLSNIRLVDLAPLAAFARIERLALQACEARPADLLALGRALPELTTLELVDRPRDRGRKLHVLGELRLPDLVAAFPRLCRLRIRSAQLTDRQAIELAESPIAARLRRLDLSHNEICEPGAGALERSGHLAGLVSLHLRDNPIAEAFRERVETRYRKTRYTPPTNRYPAHWLEPLASGNKIQAIKHYREATSAYLVDAQMAIERIMEELDLGSFPVGAIARWT